uniref:Astacin domain-containing protein n=1 Tax=Angiostrongylus cantonensis TaxID=6313 RepID=A0A0K0D6H6_ANGCA
MRVIGFQFLISCAIVYSSIMRAVPSVNKKSFEEKPQEGYQLLKNEPNAIGTKTPEQLNGVEEEVKKEFSTFSAEKVSSVGNQIKKYTEEKGSELNSGTIEEVTEDGKAYTPFFEGDIILTKEGEDEIMYDEEHDGTERVKRQVYRGVKRMWPNGLVYYSFAANATDRTKRVFKKSANAWSEDTCINFEESETGFIKTQNEENK